MSTDETAVKRVTAGGGAAVASYTRHEASAEERGRLSRRSLMESSASYKLCDCRGQVAGSEKRRYGEVESESAARAKETASSRRQAGEKASALDQRKHRLDRAAAAEPTRSTQAGSQAGGCSCRARAGYVARRRPSGKQAVRAGGSSFWTPRISGRRTQNSLPCGGGGGVQEGRLFLLSAVQP